MRCDTLQIDVASLSQYWLDRWLAEGDCAIEAYLKKQQQDEANIAKMKLAGARLRLKNKPKTQQEKSRIRREGIAIKVKYNPRKKIQPKAVVEKGLLDFLGYIDIIRKNTNEDNLIENDEVCNFLLGDNNSMWFLYKKYKRTFRHYMYINEFLPKSAEMNMDDLIMEGYIYIMGLIKKGSFKGYNFVAFCCVALKFWTYKYYKENGYSVEYTRKNLFNGRTNNRKFENR